MNIFFNPIQKQIIEKKAKQPGNAEICQNLISMFAQIPPDWQNLEKIFRQYSFTKEQLAEIAISLSEDCFCEYRDAVDEKIENVTPDHLHSNYLLNSLQMLLDNGLDPNVYIGKYEENVMWELQYVDAPNIAAAAMRLMLENGADPNRIVPSEKESIFQYIDFKVSYDSYTHEDFFTVQCWLVLMAYGGCWSNGEIPLTMLNGNDVEIFKEFENFDYWLETLPKEPGHYGCWIMHIFDTRTKEEVARYG